MRVRVRLFIVAVSVAVRGALIVPSQSPALARGPLSFVSCVGSGGHLHFDPPLSATARRPASATTVSKPSRSRTSHLISVPRVAAAGWERESGPVPLWSRSRRSRHRRR